MKVAIFGSVHSLEMLEEAEYDEKSNIELFNKFKPDIICGEVRPEDYERKTRYMGSGEYKRYIFKYCEENNIKFIPCDSYADEDVALNYELATVKITEEQSRNYELVMKDFFKVGKRSEILYNSNEFNEIVRK